MYAKTTFVSDHKVEEYVFCLPEVQTLPDRLPNGSQQSVDFISRNPLGLFNRRNQGPALQTGGADGLLF